MPDAPKLSPVLIRGLVAGTVMFAIGAAFHWLLPILAPWIAALFVPPVFRPWCGWTLIYMIVHPFWFGLAFAWLFTVLEPRARTTLAGARFGAALFLVGALPVYLLCFASIAIPRPVIVCWLLQGLTQYVLAGAALACRRVGPGSSKAVPPPVNRPAYPDPGPSATVGEPRCTTSFVIPLTRSSAKSGRPGTA